MKKSQKHCVLSLSGGMDSSTLLLHLLYYRYKVTAVSFDYGQKHKIELEKAKELVNYLNSLGYENLIDHKIIKIEGLTELLNSTLVEGGSEVPEGHYSSENMKDTVVPNRNKIFSSIIQAIALSIANKNNCFVDIALGTHSGDHLIYLDCVSEFRDADLHAFKIGNWNSERVNYYTPYMNTDKTGILEEGYELCEELGIDFNQFYEKTNTSYKPLNIEGKYYSDYKSASSVERVEAFINLDLIDPLNYADETGPVSWEKVINHVKNVLSNHNK